MYRILLFVCTASLALYSCNSATPQKNFELAALNCNLLYGFAGYELKRDLASPQEKLVDEKTMKMARITRGEVVKEKLTRVEENYEKVKSLGSNDDAAAMIKASLVLYEFVLPVYKNEYTQLAALYDKNTAPGIIVAAEKKIRDKYAARFEELYKNVTNTGMVYAEKNGLKVRQVNPSPSN